MWIQGGNLVVLDLDKQHAQGQCVGIGFFHDISFVLLSGTVF